MSEEPYFGWRTDEQLKSDIAGHREELEDARKSIEYHEGYIRKMQAELDRRELEAYWQRHPELMRLEVGDKLLVTEEFLTSGHANDFPHIWRRFRVIYFLDVLTDDDLIVVKNKLEGSYTRVSTPSKVADGMRRAYLASIGDHDDR